MDRVWDAVRGIASGPALAEGLRALMTERALGETELAQAAGLPLELLSHALGGEGTLSVGQLARLAAATRCRAIEFLQRTNILSLTTYAAGLDPLFFLPEGQVRYDARIYMREINPRYPVPEHDMTKRNPTLVAIAKDELLDGVGKLELELTYLLRAAVQSAGPAL